MIANNNNNTPVEAADRGAGSGGNNKYTRYISITA